MPCMALCDDDPSVDAAALRRQQRDAHFAYIESILPRLLVAGPISRCAEGAHVASLFVYDTEDEAEARRLLENDPYFTAGIYGSVRLEAFLPAAGGWLGGTVWSRD